MKVKVLAFATAAEALGGREHELTLGEGATVGLVLQRLEEQSPALKKLRSRLAVALNGELSRLDAPLSDLDEVALLPPVSGGDHRRAARLVRSPITASDVSRPDPGCGAEVIFLGRVRNHSKDSDSNPLPGVTKITYQGYETMAEKRLISICADLSRAGVELEIIHRLGEVQVGEASVAIAARAPHRSEAFAACAEALERLKREAPIWKLEHYVDGSLAWREEEPLAAEIGSPSASA